jgi:putative membrane protein
MNMNLKAKYRRRVLENSLILATSILTSTAVLADHDDQDKSSAAQGAPGQHESGSRGDHAGNKTEHFIKEAAMGGQMEVKMGQLAQQNGQSQEVKNLGSTLVKDHTEANQKLQQLAQQKGITLSQSGDSKHQKGLDALQSKSGAEFDKAFVTHAIKDHKKDIAKFEKCQKEEKDAQVKAFIDETLPTLRNHLQMAQAAARTLGVDVNVAADADDDNDTSAGAPATGVSGSKENSTSQQSDTSNSSTSSSSDKPQSANIQGNVGDNSVSASADLNSDRTSSSSSADVSTSSSESGKIIQKGDGKVLGLSTDKHDGKFLGIIPDPRSTSSSSSSSTSSSSDDASIGGPASTSTGSSSSSERVEFSSTPSQVKQALQSQGVDSSTSIKRMTVYEADVNGKKIHVTEDGKVYKHDLSDSSNR